MSTPEKPKIEYPCDWTYTVIGREENRMRAAIDVLLSKRVYTVIFSHHSTNKNYISLHVHTKVSSEGERDEIFLALKNHSAIQFVL